MALPKLFQRIFWHNNTTPAIQEDNLNAMSKGLSDVDDRVIGLAGTIMEDVPQIQEDIEELEADMALIDTKIASATAEANRATTAANNAAASVISAGNKALVSEGWAKGTQNGAAVGSTSPYYHNNAEYFKNQARSFTPQGYQDLVDDVDSLNETLTNFEESITGEVVDSEPYVLRQGLGNLADMALVGGSVAWNQLAPALTSSDFVAYNGTVTFANGVATFTGSASSSALFQNSKKRTKGVLNHKYLVIAQVKLTSGTDKVKLAVRRDNLIFGEKACASNTNWQTLATIGNYPDSTDAQIYPTVLDTRGSGWDAVQVTNLMLFDLTKLFGSSIADYIYSLEQATAGAGVAWFRQYFPNAYYGYQSGKIESVNVASRKVVGKNLFDVNSSPIINCWINAIDNVIASGDSYRLTYIKVLPNTTYTASKVAGKTFRMATTIEEPASGVPVTSTVADHTNTHLSITTGANDKYVAVLFYSQANGDTLTPQQIMETLQIEIGAEATAYKPYQSSTYAFDSSKQLRGIPKLVDNKLSYDGDIYTADGSVTRKYGIVDMGTLDWNYNSEYAVHNTNIISSLLTADSVKMICSKYTVISPQNVSNMGSQSSGVICKAQGAQFLRVKDTSYSDAATFKTAMSGVYLVYELATPTTESANAYQNPQRAFIDGTEEFVDYGVQSATRDVSIPVGNNTTYQLNETLPPTEDYVDGAVKFKAAISALGTDESGRTTASRAYTTGEFFYKDGKMYKVLTSIAQGATFTINTNCQQTTLFAELKALAQ